TTINCFKHLPVGAPSLWKSLPIQMIRATMLSAVCLLTAYIKRPLPLNIHNGNTVVKISEPENQWLGYT
ncbi:hypothetical protein L9F63_017369, partial [Diploptera punctata]